MNYYISLLIWICVQAMDQINSPEQAMSFLSKHQEFTLLGQWTETSNHLVKIENQFDDNNTLLTITPKLNSLFNSKHDYVLTYTLNQNKFTYDIINKIYNWDDLIVMITLGNSIRGFTYYDCQADLQLKFRGNPEKIEYHQPVFIVSSQFNKQCKITEDRIKRFTFSDEFFKQQTLSFALLTTIVALTQTICSFILIRWYLDTTSFNSTTLSIILIQDVYMCLFSALLFDIYSDWMYYFIPSLISQLIAIMLDLQIKIQAQDYEQPTECFNIMKSILFGLIELIAISYLFSEIRHTVPLYILNLYLVPQILETFWQGRRGHFNKLYVFGILMPRSLIALYLRGCPLNWLQLEVKHEACGWILTICITQVVIYYCQCKWGWFLKQPNGHNYFMSNSVVQQQADCVICLTQLTEQSTIEIELEEYQDPHIKGTLRDASKNKLLMVTPCNHHFHPQCLSTWIQVNPTCPLCKQQLPQIL